MYEEEAGIDVHEDDTEWTNPFYEQDSMHSNHVEPPQSKKKRSNTCNAVCTESDVYISKLKHTRTIIHIDIDCFYAQVEMIRNPKLRDKPLGIQQKYIVVTCNYKAREFGVTKLMTLKDAKEKCPQLVLVNGEDLTHYREMSYKISEFLQKYTPNVERLGFDENYLDVSEMVKQRIISRCQGTEVKGHTYGSNEEEDTTIDTVQCDCGCQERLIVGSEIANDIRSALYDELGVTCCAGISYNKLLSKLVGEQHKPNQQTTLFPHQTQTFMSSMKKASKIPGIGSTTSKKLARLGIVSVLHLQEIPVADLIPEIGESQAFTNKQLSYGIDDSPIVPYGRPQTISDEDSFKNCRTVPDVRSKASQLLQSLLQRLKEDGRIVQTIRLSIRKLTADKQWTNRESRQCPVPNHVATKIIQGKTDLILPELEKLVLALFMKLVDTNTPFHLTLMNIAFCNLADKPKNSIQNFLSPTKSETLSKNKTEKQTAENGITDSENMNKAKKGILSFFKAAQDKTKENEKSELEIQTGHERKRKCESSFSENSLKKVKGVSEDLTMEPSTSFSVDSNFMEGVDQDVLSQLPPDIQKEIFESSKNNQSCNSKNNIDTDNISNQCDTKDNELKKKLMTAGIDVNDFLSFPPEVQKDIMEQYKIDVKSKTSSVAQQHKRSILTYFTSKNKSPK
ncbi:DNA polymerase iota-like [Mytilus galloprovincialis]|uniref:DNA polymerase iota-like n=1 Tax=Mytilus galloprovincialis TaxID=29158 RepID=UPI003F7C9EE3